MAAFFLFNSYSSRKIPDGRHRLPLCLRRPSSVVVRCPSSVVTRTRYWKEWMWENYSNLQSPASTRLVRLQSFVRVWKESSLTRIQGS